MGHGPDPVLPGTRRIVADLAGPAGLCLPALRRERRLQLKWLLSGAAAGIILAVGGFVVSITVPALNGIGSAAGTLGILALPVSLGVGILKFRLYDIDRIISRTLAYAIVTALLVGVYAGLVLLATQGLAIKSPVAVAASTLAVAALFNPLRHRVQRAVDRRFNRARYDADQTVTAFAARLKDAVDLNSVRDDLAGVVAKALEPVHVSVWMSEHHWPAGPASPTLSVPETCLRTTLHVPLATNLFWRAKISESSAAE